MPTELSKETALTLSLGTIAAVGAVVIGGVVWGNNKLHELDQLREDSARQTSALNSLQNTIASQTQTIAGLQSSITVSRCREEEVKRVIARTVDTMNQLAVIMEQTPQFAASRAQPQFDGIRQELLNWKCE